MNMKCLDDLMKYHGVEPYNTSANICLKDPIFAQHIRVKYSSEDKEQCEAYLKKEKLI